MHVRKKVTNEKRLCCSGREFVSIATDDAELDEARWGSSKECVGGRVLQRKGEGLRERAGTRAEHGEQVRRHGEARAGADAVVEPLEAHDGYCAREAQRDDAAERVHTLALRQEHEARLCPLRTLALRAPRQSTHNASAVRLDRTLHTCRVCCGVQDELHPIQEQCRGLRFPSFS